MATVISVPYSYSSDNFVTLFPGLSADSESGPSPKFSENKSLCSTMPSSRSSEEGDELGENFIYKQNK